MLGGSESVHRFGAGGVAILAEGVRMSQATIRAWLMRFCLAQALIFVLLAVSDPI
jgi:hypothetical protein